MTRLIILFLALLSWAIFSKVQGNGFIEYAFFPLSSLKEIWPGYLAHISLGIGFISLARVIYDQEKIFVKQMRIFFWLVVMRFFDYVIESNKGWFSIPIFDYSYPVSFDTVAFIVFGYVLLFKTNIYERGDNS